MNLRSTRGEDGARLFTMEDTIYDMQLRAAEVAASKALLREIHETARDESESVVDRLVRIQNMTEEYTK